MVSDRFKKVLPQNSPATEGIEDQVERMLFDLIGKINDKRPEDRNIAKEKNTELFGEGGALDSLELVNLIVAFEEKIRSNLNLAITLADDRAMSQKRNPFRSIGSLTDYAIMLIKEKVNGQQKSL